MTSRIGASLTSPVTDLNEGKGFTPGQVLTDHRGYRWVYGQAQSAISAYNYVCIDEVGDAYLGTKTLVDTGAQVAVAPVAFAADEYGWFQISGVLSVLTAASCAADATLYTSGTAGQVDDSSTSQTMLAGLVLTTATTTAAATGAAFAGHAGIFTPGSI